MSNSVDVIIRVSGIPLMWIKGMRSEGVVSMEGFVPHLGHCPLKEGEDNARVAVHQDNAVGSQKA